MHYDEFVFDEDMSYDGPSYTLDTILEAISEPVNYDVDVLFGSIAKKSYHVSALLQNDHAIARYNVDTILILDKTNPKFRESIINAIYISCARTCEDLYIAISEMGLRLQLSYASGSDLNLYWAKVLSLRRRYLESDEDYRTRLMARMTLMKSSGTIPELELLVDTILGISNSATFRNYWPAELRVDWNSYVAMKAAEAKIDKISEALDEAVAAGVTWSTSFPYKEYDVDAAISGYGKIKYSIDTNISNFKSHIYRIVIDLLETGSKDYEISSFFETVNELNLIVDSKFIDINSLDLLVGSYIEGPQIISYEQDVRLVHPKEKDLEEDVILVKEKPLPYNITSFLEKNKMWFYLLTVVVE